MQTLKFKTTFKCQGCINTVQPYLDKLEGVIKWKVLDKKGHKELVVEADDNTQKQKIIDAVQAAGYDAVEKKGGLLNNIFN